MPGNANVSGAGFPFRWRGPDEKEQRRNNGRRLSRADCQVRGRGCNDLDQAVGDGAEVQSWTPGGHPFDFAGYPTNLETRSTGPGATVAISVE
ncbi:uncharacterized protein ColSpa_00707 [Colletotrichum spaethianum]|uniref:Uncharacterized protein n=1 Tax=Colletotrichum spaethianum TaxID=700344 RepID=A0AA37L224_9PEZI|nr:uncharacterized protein ColSpa_00707 [Colletotrichum spaethianum]GKT40526.1 hypothetical protein ColSpa_00707 [Colletotrichum spaethianum]